MLGMPATLSSYSLEGIEAGRILHSVRIESIESVASVMEHVVNARTSPDRNLAP